jgi:hypothetical protein
MTTRALVRVLALTLLTTACDAPTAPKQAKAPTKPVAAKASDPAPTPTPPAQPVATPEPTPPVAIPEPPPEPVADTDGAAPPEGELPPEAEPPVEPTPPPTPANTDDPRDPSLIPAGTPAANAKAFAKLPVNKGDGPPIGGIGPDGIHIDALEVGKGWEKSRCDLVGNSFTAGVDEKVNVCMRVVHKRADDELTIYWEQDGKVAQRSKVTVKAIPAYLTRGWLPVTKSRVGKWKAVVKASDGTVLGEASFEIK